MILIIVSLYRLYFCVWYLTECKTKIHIDGSIPVKISNTDQRRRVRRANSVFVSTTRGSLNDKRPQNNGAVSRMRDPSNAQTTNK